MENLTTNLTSQTGAALEPGARKPPPLLLGAALLFWGWQTGFLGISILMATILESAWVIQARWELSDQDFNRIWTFCTLLFFGAAIYAFTANKGPADFLGLFESPSFFTQHNAGLAGARTAASLLRWQPIIVFILIGAQTFSMRQGVPLQTLSLIFRRRWKREQKPGRPIEGKRELDISWAYLVMCLCAASIHPGEDTLFFWGLSGLVGWALLPPRSSRSVLQWWTIALVVSVGLGYAGQRGLGQLRRWIDGYNPGWLSRSVGGGGDPERSKTGLGSIGRLKGSARIVIRLELRAGAAPGLLREASYRVYRNQTWLAGTNSIFVDATPQSTTAMLLPDKTNTANTVNIGCYLRRNQGLLPLPEGSALLENLPVFTLATNSLGAVLVRGPGLLLFDAHFGPGPTIDSPSDTNEDLSVPEHEKPALNRVASELKLAGQKPFQALQTISAFFRSNFTYRSWQELDNLTSTNETPLSRFLLRRHYGHCEYFATATVLLLRTARIPARYAVGYAVHEASGGSYVVRQHDAHAWCLVWDGRRRIWQDLDTTPASWVESDARVPAWQILSDAWSRLMFEFSKFRWGQSHVRQYFLWALGPVLVLLLFQIFWQLRRHRRRSQALAPVGKDTRPGFDSEFYQLEEILVKRGLSRHPSQALSGWLKHAANDPAVLELRNDLEGLLKLHYRYRFDPQGIDPADRIRLRAGVQRCVSLLSEAGKGEDLLK